VDPCTLFTDAHQDEPVAVGLEMPGAFLTLRYILGDANVVKSDSWQADMDRLGKEFDACFEMALSGGLMRDEGGTGAPDSDADDPVMLHLSR
jgi:hypothetical protein